MTKARRIVLIGARIDGQAGVVLNIVRQFGLYDVAGFLDDDASLHERKISGIPVLGGIERFLRNVPRGVEGAHICIGDNAVREDCYESLKKHGVGLVNVVHPSAVISKDVAMGEGVFIGPGAVVMNGVSIGNCATINTAATIDHDNAVEDFANISPGAHTSGRVRIMKGAFIGTGVIVIPDITIGRNAFVGAGSVVTRDVPDGKRVAGVPARGIGGK